MKTALLFSGQGSQYVGMLKDFYEKFPQAKKLIEKANEILGYSLSSICFEGPIEKLKETRYTQPAIFLHSAVIISLLKNVIKFDATAGHSVGEYAALFASEVIDFESAIKLVSLRGELMFKAGEILPGTMFAIINLADEKVEEVCNVLTEKGNGNIVVAANYNCPGQVVVSGSAEYLRQNIYKFKEAGARIVTELTVSGAFHSPLVEPAKQELEQQIKKLEFKDAKVPVYSNVFAKPLTLANDIKNALVLQLTSPVRWSQSLQKMKENGIERYIEIGPGQVLQGLTKRTLAGVEILGIDKSEDLEKFI